MRPIILAALMAILVGASANTADPVVRFVAQPHQPGWFACDAVSGPVVALVGRPDARGTAPITLVDRRTGRTTTRDYRVGAADHGAGQIHWSLSRDGREVGAISGINPGMVSGSGDDALPPIKHVRIDGLQLDCRWLGDMTLLAVGLKRSVVVTREGGQLVYRSFDYAKLGPPVEGTEGVTSNRPTSTIVGGTMSAGGDFYFKSGGYDIAVLPQGGLGAASVVVTRNGRLAGETRFLGYALVPVGAAAARLSSGDVWSGEGVEACRARSGAAMIDGCLIDAMTRNGASAAAIAFSRRLARDDSAGYVSAWRQAGPVGIATITFPFRANTNETDALVPATGDPILLERWQPSRADAARPDWRAFARAHPDASPVPPGEVSAPKIAAGQPFTIRLSLPMRTCHACATLGHVTVRYRFDGGGKPLGNAIESVG